MGGGGSGRGRHRSRGWAAAVRHGGALMSLGAVIADGVPDSVAASVEAAQSRAAQSEL